MAIRENIWWQQLEVRYRQNTWELGEFPVGRNVGRPRSNTFESRLAFRVGQYRDRTLTYHARCSLVHSGILKQRDGDNRSS
jgi:hypothetical protein